MATIMIEGFEQIDPSVDMTAERMEYLLLGLAPDYVTGWYDGAGDSVVHVAGGGRISGNCLRFTREATAGTGWAYDYAGMLGFAFRPKQRMTVGWAMKFSMAPESAIPLCIFRYDNGTFKGEQCGLWASPDGKLFLSTTNFNVSYAGLSAPILNPLAATPEGTFRFTQWTYVELLVNYSGSVATISIVVNGETVINAEASTTFRKMSDDDSKYVSSVHLINPSNGHFGGAGFTHDIDDMYLDDNAIRGPQWIIKMDSGAVLASSGTLGVPPDEYDATGTGAQTGSAHGDYVRFALSDLPANVGTVTAIGMNIIATIDEGIDGLIFNFRNPDGSLSSGTKRNTVSGGQPDKCFRTVSNTGPGLTMTGAGLNNLAAQLESATVI